MKHFSISLLLCWLSCSCQAQSGYCMSYADYQSNHWITLDTLYVKERSLARQVWWGSGEFKLTTGNKSIDKLLKKEAFAVFFHDSIFVNESRILCNGVKIAKGYTLAFPFGNSQLCYVSWDDNLSAKQSEMAFASAMFGVIGSGMLLPELANCCCYITKGEYRSGMIWAARVDEAYMQRLLSNHSSLLKQFMELKPTDRTRASNVLPLLRAAGYI